VQSSGTTIKYALSRPANVTIRLYDVSGQLVRQLLKAEKKQKGVYYVSWDGQDHGGQELANGVYLCEVRATPTGGGEEERKFRRIAVYRK
ncbi:T9SS type A sorting domain-containing protein, partial [candidate division TA06 bacterium]|nr:T9SS type A sorting domain-containing protein [candidate division TA06 bacterium]